jgi:lipopolysaccharide export system permease protein
MGKILSLYLCREVITPFFFGLGIFTVILFTARILKLVELVVNRGVSLFQVLQVFFYVTPAFFEVTVPMAFLLALVWGLGRLTADREVTALKSCGVSLYQLSFPLWIFTVFVVGGTFLLSLYVRPWSNTRLKQLLFEVTRTRATAGLKEKVFNDDFDGLVIYAEEIQPPGTKLRGIMIADNRDPQRKNTLFASTGLVITNERNHHLTLRLLEGVMHSVERAGETYQTTQFSIYDVTLDLLTALADTTKKLDRDPQEMSMQELQQAIVQKRSEQTDPNSELVEWHRRFSLPFACVVFSLIALPVSVQSPWSLRSHGFVVTLGIIFAYYILLTAGETLGEKGVLPAALALWLPNIMLGSIGAYCFWCTVEEKRSAFLSKSWRGRFHIDP